MRDQAEKLRELVAAIKTEKQNDVKKEIRNKKSRSISFVSGKGGVGKTNISLYFAMSLAMCNKKVLLLDADLGLANIHILLGIAPKKSIADVLENRCTITETIISGPCGISIIPGASGLESLANIDQNRLTFMMNQFRDLENSYDYILIDSAAGIGNSVVNIAANTDLAVLIMTPDPTSLADAYAVVKILYERGQKKIGTIVNMAMIEKEGMETFDRINAVVVKFLKEPLEFFGVLPMNRELQRLIRAQRLMTEKKDDEFISRVARISKIAAGISATEKESFFTRFMKNIRRV